MSRKRKPGKREPNGKLSRRPVDKQARRSIDEQSAMQVAKEARQRVFGVSEADSATELAGTVVGRLLLGKEIARPQFDAAVAYCDTYHRYLRAIDAPPGPKAVEIGRATGRSLNSDMTPEQCQRAKGQWQDARNVLVEANYYHLGSIIAAMDYLALRDEFHPHMLGDFRVGANALAKHYGLVARRAA